MTDAAPEPSTSRRSREPGYRHTNSVAAKPRNRLRPLHRLISLACICLILGGISMATASITSWADDCDTVPTGVETKDYWLHFNVPVGLMPDKQFDDRPAKIQVHRVQPVYRKKCPEVTSRAAVLVHGRTINAPVTFDTKYPAPGGGTLSVQEALAWTGIDTFAPSLLGYGESTTFKEGLDDPANASLRPFEGGSCPHPEGCDRTHNPVFGLDLQGSLLLNNPLNGQRQKHSSNVRFAGTDVWVRDIGQVSDDAIAQAQPTDGKVTLIGYSLGAMRVGRALDAAKYPGIVAKVNRAVFLSPFFFVAPNVQAPTEEAAPPTGFVTLLTLLERSQFIAADTLPPVRGAVCPGYEVAGRKDHQWAQLMADDLGRDWGGSDNQNPAGLLRSPTFSSYGWNAAVAGQLIPPTLVMQGLDDAGTPVGSANAHAIYNALPASMSNKVLVQLDCATHGMMFEGCSNAARCTPTSGTPYGGVPGQPWAGAHSTIQAALIEWITSTTFNGNPTGKFLVGSSGIANPSP
jgi:pimeloyl-ACP methyl ester carboxylesterase